MASSNLSVLLLEDQGLVRAGMRALVQLTEPSAQIQEATSYQDAVTKLSGNRFDIAFLDIDLKGEKSGLDVLEFMRMSEAETRAIMLSGQGEKDLIMHCISMGASGFILKDMENDGIFRRALDTVFQGGVFLPANILGRGGFSPTSIYRKTQPETDMTSLPARAQEVLYYLCQGLPNKSIANKMGIEEGTIRKDYVPRLFRFFHVARRTELVVEIARRGVKVPKPN